MGNSGLNDIYYGIFKYDEQCALHKDYTLKIDSPTQDAF